MKYIIPDENLSEECKSNIKESLEFLNSEQRKNYSAQRIQNDVGNYQIAAAKGLKIIKEHGSNLLSSVSKLRKERIKEAREEGNL